MRLQLAFASPALILAIPVAFTLLPAALVACGGVQQAVLISTEDGGGSGTAEGGTPAAGDASTQPGTTPAACKVPQDCNDNPAASAIWGSCEGGKCVCADPYTYAPSGKCVPITQNTVCVLAGGTCTGTLGSPGDPLCGTGVEVQTSGVGSTGCTPTQEVCCAPSCGGKTIDQADFICVRFNDGCAPPICVGGSLVCPANSSKSPKGGGCGG